jgi:sterol desaturase/sphingolipid hydroxylase (fatty acid hydroxylase superfamily)
MVFRVTLRDFLQALVSMTAIIVVRYFVVSGATYWALWRKPSARVLQLSRKKPDRAQIGAEIGLSLASSAIYAAPAAFALEVWKRGGTKMYDDLSPAAWPWMAASALIYLLIQDGFYYWLHRLMHRRELFRSLHAGHHKSAEPSPFAGFAFDPAEAALSGWLLPALAFVIPIEIHLAAALLVAMTVTGTLNHAGFEVWPRRWLEGPLGRWVISASHHSQHHARYGCNFGLHFQLWDRLMGTNAEPLAHPAWKRRAA